MKSRVRSHVSQAYHRLSSSLFSISKKSYLVEMYVGRNETSISHFDLFVVGGSDKRLQNSTFYFLIMTALDIY